MNFDIEPDGPFHGECTAEIESLRSTLAARDAEINRLVYELDKSRDSHMRIIASRDAEIQDLRRLNRNAVENGDRWEAACLHADGDIKALTKPSKSRKERVMQLTSTTWCEDCKRYPHYCACPARTEAAKYELLRTELETAQNERDSYKTAAHEWQKNWAEVKAELSAMKIAQEAMGAEYRAMKKLEEKVRVLKEVDSDAHPSSIATRHAVVVVIDTLAEMDRVRGSRG